MLANLCFQQLIIKASQLQVRKQLADQVKQKMVFTFTQSTLKLISCTSLVHALAQYGIICTNFWTNRYHVVEES